MLELKVYSNGRQKGNLLMLAIDETHAHIFSLQLECLYIEDLLYLVQIYLC